MMKTVSNLLCKFSAPTLFSLECLPCRHECVDKILEALLYLSHQRRFASSKSPRLTRVMITAMKIIELFSVLLPLIRIVRIRGSFFRGSLKFRGNFGDVLLNHTLGNW